MTFSSRANVIPSLPRHNPFIENRCSGGLLVTNSNTMMKLRISSRSSLDMDGTGHLDRSFSDMSESSRALLQDHIVAPIKRKAVQRSYETLEDTSDEELEDISKFLKEQCVLTHDSSMSSFSFSQRDLKWHESTYTLETAEAGSSSEDHDSFALDSSNHSLSMHSLHSTKSSLPLTPVGAAGRSRVSPVTFNKADRARGTVWVQSKGCDQQHLELNVGGMGMAAPPLPFEASPASEKGQKIRSLSHHLSCSPSTTSSPSSVASPSFPSCSSHQRRRRKTPTSGLRAKNRAPPSRGSIRHRRQQRRRPSVKPCIPMAPTLED